MQIIHEVPKALLPVANRPVLSYALDLLESSNLKDLIVVVEGEDAALKVGGWISSACVDRLHVEVKIQMGLHSYSQPSESEDIFGNDSHSGYSETEDLIRRDQAELSLSREPVVYPPQPEVEFGFPQTCYCGGQPHLAISTSSNDPGYIESVRDVFALIESGLHVLQLAEKVENLTLFSDYETEQKLLSLEKLVGDLAKEKSRFTFEYFVALLVLVMVLLGMLVMFY